MRRAPLAPLALLLAGCALPVEGAFVGRSLAGVDPARTIVVVYNHGFSSASAGTYRPTPPSIVRLAAERNPDVVVFAQVRNTARLESDDHSSYIEAAIGHFHRERGVPLGNIVLVGQSCGGWGALQAAAFTYPGLGGVVAFAPTCHGKLPHATPVRQRRWGELAQMAERLRAPTLIFLYEADAYYDLADWDDFERRIARRGREADVTVLRLARARVREVCPRCVPDSHAAYSGPGFAPAFFDARVQPLLERVRRRIRAALSP